MQNFNSKFNYKKENGKENKCFGINENQKVSLIISHSAILIWASSTYSISVYNYTSLQQIRDQRRREALELE